MTSKANGSPTGYFFEVCQYYYNPKTDYADDGTLREGATPLVTNERLIGECDHRKTIKRAALFVHDKDTYTENDAEGSSWKRAGAPKPPHPHLYLQTNPDVPVADVAGWFGVPPQYVIKKKGRGAFEACLEYGYHETPSAIEQGKHRYGEEALVYAKGCEPRKLVDELQAKRAGRAKRGDMSAADRLRLAVQNDGLTLREAERLDPVAFGKNITTLQRLRGWYLSEHAELPPLRTNLYVTGPGGIGKGILCRAIARSLFPDLTDEEAFFEVGHGGKAFQKYDGQPCIIYSDRRAYDFIQEFGSRGDAFELFDLTPSKAQWDIKYGSTTLVNSVSIINGIESYEEFLDGLAGAYTDRYGNERRVEDKSQSYRRFPLIIEVSEESFDLLMNKGLFDGTREYYQYHAYRNLRANMRLLKERLGEYGADSRLVQGRLCSPIVSEHRKLVNKLTPDAECDMSLFEGWGEEIPLEELVARAYAKCGGQCGRCEFGVHVAEEQTHIPPREGFSFGGSFQPHPLCEARMEAERATRRKKVRKRLMGRL